MKIVERENKKKKLGPLSKVKKYNTALNMGKTEADICSNVGSLMNEWILYKYYLIVGRVEWCLYILIFTEVTDSCNYDDDNEIAAVEDKSKGEMNVIYDCDVSGTDMIIHNETATVTEHKKKSSNF